MKTWTQLGRRLEESHGSSVDGVRRIVAYLHELFYPPTLPSDSQLHHHAFLPPLLIEPAYQSSQSAAPQSP